MIAPARVLQDGRGATFAFEMKWDGYRILAESSGGIRLRSRGGKDYTDLFPHTDEFEQMLDDDTVSAETDVVDTHAPEEENR